MIKDVVSYFKQKTEILSFIELKEDRIIGQIGLKLEKEIPFPILINELVEEIKEKQAQDALKLAAIIEGMIYTIAIDPQFQYNDKYIELLYQYNRDIEEELLYKGIKAMESNLEDALANLKALTELNSSHVRGLYNYGLALEMKAQEYFKIKDIKQGDVFLQEATQVLEGIIDIDDDFSLAYYKLGYYYRYHKQFKKAEIMWQKFLNIDENEDRIEEIKEAIIGIEDDVDYEEGYHDILRGNPVEGLKKLVPLREKYNDWWNLIFMIGLGYRQTGEYDKGKEAFERVIMLNPKQLDALNELGLCLAHLQKFDEAIEKFTEVLRVEPNNNEVLCNRGMTYLQLSKIKEAESDIQRAYEQDPNDEITLACKEEVDRMKKIF